MAQNKKKGSYPKRLLTAALVMLGLSYTVVFFGPLEMVAFSGGSLVYTYLDVAPLLALLALVPVALSPLLALLRGKVFRIALSLFSGVSVAAYLQALLLNGGLGLLTGDAIDWSQFTGNMLLSAALWLAVVGGFVLLSLQKAKLWKQVVRYGAVLLVVMQLVPTLTILSGAQVEEKAASGYYLSDCNIHVAGEENIYVFVLDRLDFDYIRSTEKAYPGFLEGLDGFTLYENAISAYARTKPALVHMLTGEEESTFRVASNIYYKRVWDGETVISRLRGNGWKTELYTSTRNLFSTESAARDHADNFSDGSSQFNYPVLTKRLLKLSALRYAPTVLKARFWGDTNYFNEDVSISDRYKTNDVHYAGRLLETRAGEGKCFKFIHFFGSHAPYTMNADGTLSDVETTVTAQTAGSFHNLQAIFGQMKAEGIYDDATILILGDHGSAVSDTKPLQKATCIGLFYKPSGSSETPLKHSQAPVCAANIPATLAKAAGLPYEDLGVALDEVAEDAPIVRTYYKTVCDPETYRERWLCTYHVTGNAADFANWTMISQEEIPYSYN